MADFAVSNQGTIFLLKPLTEPARVWCKEHLPDDVQTFGEAIVVEHRYIQDIARGIVGDGLDFEDL